MGGKRMGCVILYIHGGLGVMTLSAIDSVLPLIFEVEDLTHKETPDYMHHLRLQFYEQTPSVSIA
jgi:hypothetical protein